MTKDEMLTNLYDEYQRIKNRYDFDRLEKLLLEHSNAETGLQLGLETLAGMEAAAVISETNPEGKINGKNADSRNMQRDRFLAGFRNADPTARQIIDDLARPRVTITTTGAADARDALDAELEQREPQTLTGYISEILARSTALEKANAALTDRLDTLKTETAEWIDCLQDEDRRQAARLRELAEQVERLEKWIDGTDLAISEQICTLTERVAELEGKPAQTPT